MRIRAFLNLAEQRLVILGRRIFTVRHRQTHFTQESAQVFELFSTRTFVHAVQRRNFITAEEISGTDVRRQHALFNQHMSMIAFGRYDFLNFAFSIEHDPGFDRIKVHRPTDFTLLAKNMK